MWRQPNSYTGPTWDVLGQRISSSGTLVGESFAITEGDYPDGRPHVAASPDAGEYLIVWHMHTDGQEYSVRARRVLTDGTRLGNETVLASADELSACPRVAFNPDDEEYLAVWHDDINGNWDVFGQRLSITGTLVGGNFGVGTASWNQGFPQVAWDGRSNRYLVVWAATEDVTIEGQKVWGDGTLDGEKTTLATYGWFPEMAYGSESGIFLSVYAADDSVYARRYGIPVADFSAAPLSGSAPLTVTFSNLSYPLYGTTAYTWTFGDGATSTLTDPVHAYTTPGVYSVTLTTAVATATHTLTRTNYISVSGESGGPVTVTRTITYTYDPLGRLIGADYSTGESYEYAYDEVGSRTAYTVTLESTTVTTYTYDAANRLTAVGDVAYTWDDRGNLTSDGVFTYTYNAAGRLVQAESITGTLVYTYTAGGLRVGQSVDGDASTYAWDWASGLPEMLAEGSNLYLVGHETLAMWDGSDWVYYLPDALGSLRQETDEMGAVTTAREWTPYGVEVGTAQTGLGYTGEWQDAYRDIGLTYLRARWYRPEDARFLSPDLIIPDYRNPQSINRFAYAFGNPTTYTDPTGETPWAWPDREAILGLKQAFWNSAVRHRHPQSNMSVTAFAGLLAGIVHQEGRLYEVEGWQDRDTWDFAGDCWAVLVGLRPDKLEYPTVGIVNIRPETVLDSCNGIVRGADGRPLPGKFTYAHPDDVLECLPQCVPPSPMSPSPWNTMPDCDGPNRFMVGQLISNREAAIDALAMNLQAGVDRALYYGLKPSVYNLAMWHHRGVQLPDTIADDDLLNDGERRYGSKVIRFTADAMVLFGWEGQFRAYNDDEHRFLEPNVQSWPSHIYVPQSFSSFENPAQ